MNALAQCHIVVAVVMRVLHFSDVHVPASLDEVPWRRFFNKRAVGWLNLRLRRARRFRDAPIKLERLYGFAVQEKVDLAICSGDFTTLGTEPEMRRARGLVEPFGKLRAGLCVVPGNHDVYVGDALSQRLFEKYFHAFLETDMPHLRDDSGWPLVRLFDAPVAVVCINSARPNAEPWSSRGAVGEVQLAALDRVLKHPRVQERFVLVVTHYAPRLANGRPDSPRHGLDDADHLLEVCRSIRQGALLFGHVHQRYSVELSGLSARLFCAGSATHDGHEGCWLLDFRPGTLQATPVTWTGSEYALDRSEQVTVGAV